MTRGVKEANAAGSTGLHMTGHRDEGLHSRGRVRHGRRRTVGLVGAPSQPGGRAIEPVDDVAGLGVHETAPELLKRYGDKVAIGLIGPAGEMLLAAAGIENLDKDRSPSSRPAGDWVR